MQKIRLTAETHLHSSVYFTKQKTYYDSVVSWYVPGRRMVMWQVTELFMQ